MSGESEFGKCEVCKTETHLQRTTFHYDIKCECHSPNHFITIRHCSNCKPVEPKNTTVTFQTSILPKKTEGKQGKGSLDFFQMNT